MNKSYLYSTSTPADEIVWEHVYATTDDTRVSVVSTCPKHDKFDSKLSKFHHVYTSYAYPARAKKFIEIGCKDIIFDAVPDVTHYQEIGVI